MFTRMMLSFMMRTADEDNKKNPNRITLVDIFILLFAVTMFYLEIVGSK